MNNGLIPSNLLTPSPPFFDFKLVTITEMNSKWDFHFEKAEKLEPSTETAKEEEPA